MMRYRITDRGYEMEGGIVFAPYDCQCASCVSFRDSQDRFARTSDESKNDAPYAFWLGAAG
jgi:hypothetical protein